ncbi:MAG: flagellar filament capping protein FliD [Lachnospiraceae bacterium]
MPIRMTGLNSGLDTESIIAALMSAQRTKQTKVENKRTKLEWKKEQWASLNTKIYNFYTNSLSKMKMKSNYMTKAATSSNTSKVTAKASTNAATGSYSVEVEKLASAQKVTSGKLNGSAVRNDKGELVTDSSGKTVYEEGKITAKTKLIDLQDAGFGTGTQIKIESGDKSAYLQVDENTTVSDFVNKLNSAGLIASFDEKQQRFFINSSKSGKGNEFKISSGKMSDAQIKVTNDLKDLIGYDKLSTSNKNTADSIMAGLQSGTETVDDIIEKLTTLANDNTEKEAKQKATDLYTAEAKVKVHNEFDDEVSKELGIDKANLTDTDRKKYLEDKGYEIDKKKPLADAVKEARDKYEDKAAEKLVKSEDYYKDKIEDALKNGIKPEEVQRVRATGADIESDDAKYTFDDRMTRAVATNGEADRLAKEYAATMSTPLIDNSTDALKALGLSKIDGEAVNEGGNGNTVGMVVISAEDTRIKYNGATLTSDTTNITIAGVELNVLGVTNPGETVNISVTNDTSGVYDTIKEFVSEYNAILKEMNTFYNAGSAKDYDVLSDEEKDAMSDSEVEKWEGKIKDSLLRRDSTLGAIISSFKNNMMGVYTTADGNRYALSSIGISTSKDYKEGGLLHIRGDEDDPEYADSDNVLRKMLDENPDAVIGVFTSLADTLYSDLQKKMSATTMSSAMTFYNDKEMSSQLSDYKDEISKWQSRLDEMEDKYYKQFSAMETALANIQSQQNSLASMLGGGN